MLTFCLDQILSGTCAGGNCLHGFDWYSVGYWNKYGAFIDWGQSRLCNTEIGKNTNEHHEPYKIPRNLPLFWKSHTHLCSFYHFVVLVERFQKASLEWSLSIVSVIILMFIILRSFYLRTFSKYLTNTIVRRFDKLENGEYPSLEQILLWQSDNGFNFIENEIRSSLADMYGYETIEWIASRTNYRFKDPQTIVLLLSNARRTF